MRWYESILAGLILTEIRLFLREQPLGQVLASDGILKFLPGKIRIPDVCFISWQRFPKERLPRRPIPLLIPDLVVEVLSETNTQSEMDQKLKLYFEAGVTLVWYVNPATRTAIAYTGPGASMSVGTTEALVGGDVLAGFTLSLEKLFQEADRQGPPPPSID